MPDAIDAVIQPKDAAIQPNAENEAGTVPVTLTPPGVFDDAALLLEFAASTGRLPAPKPGDSPDPGVSLVRDLLVAGWAARTERINFDILSSFWMAYARLSNLTRPVTAASIRASNDRMILMKCRAILLVVLVILVSTWLFMVTSTTNDINDLVHDQDSAAMALWSDLQTLARESETADAGPLAQREATIKEHVFQKIMEFSRKSIGLLESASRLNSWLTFPGTSLDIKPVTFDEKNPNKITGLLVSPTLALANELRREGSKQIEAYQFIRNYALALYRTNTLIYGSITTYLLPTIYALLGAMLYELRLYSRLIRRKEYLHSAAHGARYLIALIAGLVVGLFGSLFSKSIPFTAPAIAFLVGYSVEAFFSLLDDLIKKMKRSESISPARSPAEAGAD